MANQIVSLSYRQLQTVKHGLQLRIQREGITESDKDSETALIAKIEEQIQMMRERHDF